MAWYDFFRLFSYASRQDPITRLDNKEIHGAGITQPDVPDIRNTQGGDQFAPLNIVVDGSDFIDLSTVTGRINRYKEYDRLEHVAEIGNALTTFADEACVSGDTQIATPFGYFKIKDLAKTKKPDEKFLVYCWDFSKNDYTLGWAYHPRLVKTAATVEISFDDGSTLVATPDHRCLRSDGTWVQAGDVKEEQEFLTFHRILPNHKLTESKTKQFPRIWTHTDGWKHERQFIDEWKTGKKIEKFETINTASKLIASGLNLIQTAKIMNNWRETIHQKFKKEGFTYKEICWLCKNFTGKRRVISVSQYKTTEVYDLSVEKYANFATNSIIVHNCQEDEDGHCFKIYCENDDVKEELELLLYHILDIDDRLWTDARNLFKYGDLFWEIVLNPDAPSDGIQKIQRLPTDSMYRIETVRGKLVEFQQSKTGPDHNSLTKVDPITAHKQELEQSNAIRFHKDQIIHSKIGDDRKTFYPYGVSAIEGARGPAHTLHLMEDSMVVYRLVRAPERRVFYVDVGTLSPAKTETFIERMKDQYRKKKVFNRRSPLGGASAVEERFIPPSPEEDIWVPMRQNSNTRIDTLPGACLSLNTKIPLLDGRTLTLNEIIKEYNSGKQLWTYSCCPNTGKVVPGMVTWAGVTRKNAQVMRLTFDNGDSVVCTPDHKIPVPGKGFVEAKDLIVGESLFPFNTRLKKLRKDYTNEYSQVYCNYTKEWKFVHRLVAEFFKGTDLEQQFVFEHKGRFNTIHHKNFNRFNNNPENLVWMDFQDHLKYHSKNYGWSEEQQRIRNRNISNSLIKFHSSLESDDPFYDRLRSQSSVGNEKLAIKLSNDSEFKEKFLSLKKQGWLRFSETDDYQIRGQKISDSNVQRWQDSEYKKNITRKETVVYPKSMFDKFVSMLAEDIERESIIDAINSNEVLIAEFIEANKHIKRDIDFSNGLTADRSDKMVRSYGYKNVRDLKRKLFGHVKNDVRGRQEGKVYGKSTLVFPQKMFRCFLTLVQNGVKVSKAILEINNNEELIKEFNEANAHVCRQGIDLSQGLKRTHIIRMIRSFGYEDLKHLREDAKQYNHQIVKIEYLDTMEDTGTLTIDGQNKYHNYHTFALESIFVKNSNLGEIDDAVYFRQKLYTALNFPRNYLSNNDPQATRLTLSQQDTRFARMIERLQKPLAKAIKEVCLRHLHYKGWPEEDYKDLKVRLTPPSDWRRINRNEVEEVLYNRAATMKGTQLMSDFDILTKIMDIDDDEAREIVARNKAQKIEDLKINLLAQNPGLLGFNTPEQQGTPVGTAPGGPNPELSGNAPPAELPKLGHEGEGQKNLQPGEVTPHQAIPHLPEPTPDEIKKYGLEIRDQVRDFDDEEVDDGELGDVFEE